MKQHYPRAAAAVRHPLYHTALGELQERDGNYEQALHHFTEANRLLREDSGYRVEEDEALFRVYLDTFDADYFIKAQPAWDSASPVPVFIVGMPRSGSSLVEQMLGSHSRISPLGEVHWLQAFTTDGAGVKKQFVPAKLREQMDDRRFLKKIREQYLLNLRDSAGDFAIDKLPANVQLLWLIHRVFPEALVIHTRREKWPTVWSCFRTRFAEGNHFSESIDDCARYHDAVISLTEAWGPLMGDRYLEVSYEAFVDDPEAGINEILGRLALAPEPACYDPTSSRRVVRTASQTQVTRPVYRHANQGWQHYRKLLRVAADD